VASSSAFCTVQDNFSLSILWFEIDSLLHIYEALHSKFCSYTKEHVSSSSILYDLSVKRVGKGKIEAAADVTPCTNNESQNFFCIGKVVCCIKLKYIGKF